MTDFSATIVTYIDSDTPFNWGLELERIRIPMVVFTSPLYLEKLSQVNNPMVVTSVYFAQGFLNSTFEKILLLDNVSKTNPFNTSHLYWLDSEYLQSTLSFEFLYSSLLEKWLFSQKGDLQVFYHDGHRHDMFYGGKVSKLNNLINQWEELTKPLFIPTKTSIEVQESLAPHFLDFMSSGANVHIAEIVNEPVLHIVGDSHTLYSLTPLKPIGARNDIFLSTGDVSNVKIPFNFQFTHHIGAYSMYSFTQQRILNEDLLKQFKIKPGDFLLFVFGEIDVRCHLWNQVKEKSGSLLQEVHSLVTDYISYLCELRKATGADIGVFGIIPPFNPPNYDSEHKPIVGTLEERIQGALLMNQLLEENARLNGFFYVDVYSLYATENGDLPEDITDSFCHISHYHKQPGLDHIYTSLNIFLSGREENIF